MKHIILDVDTGIDDALAIAYAVHSPELNILGITTTFGNTSVHEATRNTCQLLQMLGAQDIPVFQGMEETFTGRTPAEKTTWIHGENGLGNVVLPPASKQAESMLAHDFIVSAIHNHPNDITILTTANQNNLARAIQKDPDIVHLAKDVILMGGAVTVPGNVTSYAESNIYHDPEAAQFTFQSGIPMTLVGLDVTQKTLLKRNVLAEWRKNDTVPSRFLAAMCDFYMDAYAERNPNLDGCALHDPLVIGIAIDATLVKTKTMSVSVMTEGSANGQTVGEENRDGHIDVCVEVNADRFVDHFLNRVIRTE
ncbi:purine nucleosidase [Lentibacillus halodurans]|uniref:Purine nucleosidase n=1 Tax=Lentibacillus halodurans TaxID=237679 RepID=A0A1I0ZXN2_9BACI|nr:nucleoside hydrolase [Lentibacillus halodurans]SFB30524.1 purine nucleosidase [Lentibacillus halodurans]